MGYLSETGNVGSHKTAWWARELSNNRGRTWPYGKARAQKRF